MPATKSRTNMRLVYLAIFDGFAVTKSDIEKETSLSKSQVTSAVNALAAVDLITSHDVNSEAQGSARRGQYKEVVWQCWQSHDDIPVERAVELFEEKFPETDAAPTSRSNRQAGPTPAKTDSGPTSAPRGPKKTPLTNSRRRALLRLANGPVKSKGMTDLSRQPLDFFVEQNLATASVNKAGEITSYKITKAGADRAADIDPAKYGSKE